MDLGGRGRRGGSVPKAGSVWESRMKLDEVKGGINALIAADGIAKTGDTGNSTGVSVSESGKAVDRVSPPCNGGGKRKTWKSEVSPLRIAGEKSESSPDLDRKLKESSVSGQGIKPSPCRSLRFRDESSDLGNLKSGDRAESLSGKFDDKKVLDEFKIAPDELRAPRSEEDGCDAQFRVPFEEADSVDPEVSGRIQGRLEEASQKNSSSEKKLTANANQVIFQPSPTKSKPISGPVHSREIPRTSRIQIYVDLIMWRDVSKSAFISGIGTFAIVSSSFTNIPNISAISVLSYLGLLYLSASFLFRSLITRGSADEDGKNQRFVFGEDDAIRVAKQVFPYVNEFLLKLRALFSGDPATTMKLAVLLFVLAQFGSSITIWKVAKLGFIGVFTVPKICSSYSSQLSSHGRLWMRRFHGVWESCAHKKIIAAAIFAIIWNAMSVVARVWAVFMLFVAFKGYQESRIFEEEVSDRR